MAIPTQSTFPLMMSGSHDKNDDEKCNNNTLLIPADLPREREWVNDEDIFLFNGFWYPSGVINGLLALQQHLKPHPNDVFSASFPKSGTTWLDALLFCIVNRATYNVVNHDNNANIMHPLLTSNPHDLVPWLEAYAAINPTSPRPETSLFQTHLAYPSLPQQISNSSSCRIVYIFRDPKDVFVSFWHAVTKVRAKELPPISLQEAFDQFSRGASPFGPYWDHVTGYYKASVQFPDKVFLVRYEDLKKETVVYVKRLAEFLGQPFSEEEENEGLPQNITDLCSFEKLSNLEVNKDGTRHGTYSGKKMSVRNNMYFRKGEIGDAKNHLTREMMEILDQITKEKFKEFGLTTYVPELFKL